MATSSYSNLFGTTGAGQQGSQAGIGTMFGQQAKPETDEERQRREQQQQQPTQTFAQLQKQGMARPAPSAPQAQPFAQYGGSQQAQQARTGMLGALQQQLAQPTRFDTEAFQKIRQAQAAQLGAEYQAQQSQLNEELARRGLSASSIGAGRMGDLAGQQARALAQLDAQLLQQAAQTQAQDRLAAIQAAQGFSELAGAQDLAQFEANRVAQAAQFQQGLQQAQFEQGQTEFERGQALQAAQAQQAGQESAMERGLREALGIGGLGVQQREVDLKAQQIQQEAAIQGRQMTLQEAQAQAQQEQFAATQAQREREFQATLNADEQRFVRTLKEQQDARLQQLGISTRQLDLDAAKLQSDAALQGRSLTLQEARDAAEVSYRAKALEQEATLAGRRISSEEAMAQAQRQLAQYTTDVQAQLQREGIVVDRERLAATERQANLDRTLREQLGAAEFTGTYGGQQTLPAQQAQQNMLIQLAGILAGGGAATQAQMPALMQRLYAAFGITPASTPASTPGSTPPSGPSVGQTSPDGAYRWNGTSWEPNIPRMPAGSDATGSAPPPSY